MTFLYYFMSERNFGVPTPKEIGEKVIEEQQRHDIKALGEIGSLVLRAKQGDGKGAKGKKKSTWEERQIQQIQKKRK